MCFCPWSKLTGPNSIGVLQMIGRLYFTCLTAVISLGVYMNVRFVVSATRGSIVSSLLCSLWKTDNFLDSLTDDLLETAWVVYDLDLDNNKLLLHGSLQLLQERSKWLEIKTQILLWNSKNFKENLDYDQRWLALSFQGALQLMPHEQNNVIFHR